MFMHFPSFDFPSSNRRRRQPSPLPTVPLHRGRKIADAQPVLRAEATPPAEDSRTSTSFRLLRDTTRQVLTESLGTLPHKGTSGPRAA